MILRGKVWKFGENIDTDVIIPNNYCNIADAREFAQYCMHNIDPEFHKRVKPGDVIVAGRNFGCGSSREPAPLAIKATGISCVVAASFARIFYRNAFNVGLPILECAEASDRIEEGHEIRIDLDTGRIEDLSLGTSFQSKPIPSFMQDLVSCGGLMNHIRKRLKIGNFGVQQGRHPT